jgi:hypothetical protein
MLDDFEVVSDEQRMYVRQSREPRLGIPSSNRHTAVQTPLDQGLCKGYDDLHSLSTKSTAKT